MTAPEQPTPELDDLDALVQDLRDHGDEWSWDETRQRINRFAVQRAAEAVERERERISAELDIPFLVVSGQAREAEPTEADKAWAADIISKRATPPPGDAGERARVIVKQRYEQDCFLCCIAMAIDLDYDEALAKWGAELVDHVAAHGLVGRKDIDRAFSALGLQRDRDYVTILMEFPGHETWERAEIRKLLWGRRACIQVKSKNYENRFHVVYWDGERLIDPSNLKTYSDMGEVEPIFVWIFDERCALQSERTAAASQALLGAALIVEDEQDRGGSLAGAAHRLRALATPQESAS